MRDTGRGVAPEDQQLIFEEFRQVDGGYNRLAGGTGLGLAITMGLLHGFNAYITKPLDMRLFLDTVSATLQGTMQRP